MRNIAIAVCVLMLCAACHAGPATRPAVVSAKDWGSTPQPIPDSRKHTPKYVNIHHAGTEWKGGEPAKFVKNMQGWGQREKGWPDVPYHFLIAPDGTIFEGRALSYEPDTNTKYELKGNINVEMMGNFEIQRPSQAQLESCARITAWIADEYHIDEKDIRTHKDVAPGQTTCPGKDFYRYLEDGEFKKWVADLRAGKQPKIEPGPPLKDGPTRSILDVPPATAPAKP